MISLWKTLAPTDEDKPILKNKLYCLVDTKYKIFKGEAKKHKNLHRFTWWAATLISLAMALLSNLKLEMIAHATVEKIVAALGILLPVITAYVVLRSPEKLWVFEISIRNQLSDLKDRIELEYGRDPQFDTAKLEKDYLKVLDDSSKSWAKIRNASD